MRHFLVILVNIGISYLLSLFLPWWSIIFAPFLAGALLDFKPATHALLGFVSICILWATQSYLAYLGQAAELTIMIGNLFSGLSPFILVIVAAIIGGLYGALAQLTGSFLQSSIRK